MYYLFVSFEVIQYFTIFVLALLKAVIFKLKKKQSKTFRGLLNSIIHCYYILELFTFVPI